MIHAQAEHKPMRRTIQLPKKLWDDVSEYRFDERIESLGEAVRQLIAAGLEAKKAPK